MEHASPIKKTLQQSSSVPGPSQAAADYHFSLAEKGWGGFVVELFRRFGVDQCAVWAAALSFFALLSLVPLLVGGFALIGFLIRDPHEAALQVQNLLAKFLPLSNPGEVARKLIESAGIEQQAEKLRQSSGIAGVISLITFLFTASRIFVNAAPPMNAAFRAEETRGFVKINVYAVGLLIGTSLLFILSLFPTYGMAFVQKLPFFAGLPTAPAFLLDFVLLLLSIAINALLFATIYRFLPSPKAGITWRMAFVGGIFVAVLFELGKQGFALYLRNFGGGASYDKAYGSLGVVAILFLWIHISSQLLLLGAELARLFTDTQLGAGDTAPKAVAPTETIKKQSALSSAGGMSTWSITAPLTSKTLPALHNGPSEPHTGPTKPAAPSSVLAAFVVAALWSIPFLLPRSSPRQ